MTTNVEHDTAGHRFLAQVASGTAVLSYATARPGVLELYRTFVPEPDRGRGIGGQLVEAAVRYAREHAMQVIPTCWYVAQWIREHPESSDVVISR